MKTVVCDNKEHAKSEGDKIGWRNVTDWKFLENGKVVLIVEEKEG